MNEHNIVTIPLSTNALNCELALAIMDDCRQACEPSSYATKANSIFVRADLMTDEACVVVALPGISSAAVPPSSEQPNAIVLRGRHNDIGTAYLRLRREQVLLETYTLRVAEPGSRHLVLYLFEDGCSLDVIPATTALQEEMWIHEMSAQSRHPVSGASSNTETANAFELPVIIKRALCVTEEESASDQDCPTTLGDDEESIPF